MFLDRYSQERFRLEAQQLKCAVEGRVRLIAKYTNEGFLNDVEMLISMFEGERSLVPKEVKEIEARMLPFFEEFSDAHSIYRTDLFSLLQACKMGFIKEGGLLTSVEIIEREGITRQQFHIQSYDVTANIPEEQKKNKLPIFKVGRLACATRRDVEAWSASRPRKRRRDD